MTDNNDDIENTQAKVIDFAARRVKTPEPKVVPTRQASDKTKLLVFGSFIADSMTLVEFTTSYPGVKAPPDSMVKGVERVNFSTKFGLADFVFDDDGVRATLRFNGVNHFVDLPWGSIFRMTQRTTFETVTWPNDAPAIEPKDLEQAEEPPPN